MAALVQFDAAQSGDVAVLHVDQAGGDAASEHPLGGLRHGGPGLARADHVDMAKSGDVEPFELSRHGLRRIGRRQRGAEDRERLPA